MLDYLDPPDDGDAATNRYHGRNQQHQHYQYYQQPQQQQQPHVYHYSQHQHLPPHAPDDPAYPYPQPSAAAAPTTGAAKEEEAGKATADSGGILGALGRLFGGGSAPGEGQPPGNDKPAALAPAPHPSIPPPPTTTGPNNRRKRHDPRRTSYASGERLADDGGSMAMVVAQAPPPANAAPPGSTVIHAAPPTAASKILSLLPSLPFLPLSSEAAAQQQQQQQQQQLSPDALDVVVRYLALYRRHAARPDSVLHTRELQREAECLMLAMRPRTARSLHACLVTLQRVPDADLALDGRLLERYVHAGDQQAFETLVAGLREVLTGLAGVLGGGFTVPGGWVDDDGE